MKVTFDVNYYRVVHGERRWSHKYSESWHPTDWHCILCGATTVWEAEEGCIIAGEQCICTACGGTWTLPNSPTRIDKDGADEQRLEHLRQPHTEGGE